MRAVIVGGSIAGLFAANTLERQGWEVIVLERTAEPLSARGAGVVTHPELFRGLAQAGVAEHELDTIAVERRVTFGPAGTSSQMIDFPQRLVAWGELHMRLERALRNTRLMRGSVLSGYADETDRVVITLADGDQIEADVLIGADGFRSTVRRLLLPDEDLNYAGYVAWRGLVSENDLDAETAGALMSCFSFGFPAGEQIVGYPVAKPSSVDAGKDRQFNYVWYRPVPDRSHLEALLTAADGTIFRDGIPPLLIPPERLEQMRQDAADVLPPALGAAVRATRQPLLQPIYDFAASRFARGRVALIGDSAVVARPHCGMGVTKAGSDAATLSRLLGEHTRDVPDALRRYDAIRRPIGFALVAHAQHLGETIGCGKTPAEPQDVLRLMSEIAVAPELEPAG